MRYADSHCTYTESREGGKHVYVFTGPCTVTGKPHSVTIPGEELYAYRRGALIQTAMPSVSRDDAEFLMSGMSPEGWKQTFGDDESCEDCGKTPCICEEAYQKTHQVIEWDGQDNTVEYAFEGTEEECSSWMERHKPPEGHSYGIQEIPEDTFDEPEETTFGARVDR